MPSDQLSSFYGMIGQSAAMQALFRRIARVAPIDVPVLIRGESGTGKELVAGAIQQLSPRRGGPFETVNCGALTRELLLSELFGHERGAFTGAVARKTGLLAVAHGGTLLLDEVGELPLDAQAMLLRFLQHGEVRPVGSTQTTRVDVRFISATHRDLEAAVERRMFREDLYYRLRHVVVDVPALRGRREDIRILVEHFRLRLNQRYGLSVRGVTAEALAALEGHSWRGNVRELEAVLEQAMIFQDGGWVRAEDLGLSTPGSRGPHAVERRSGHGGGVRLHLTQYREIALRIARTRGAVTRRDLARQCGISGESARLELLALVRLGHLRRAGHGRSTRYVVP